MNSYYIDTHIHLDLCDNLDCEVDYINSNKIYTISVTNHPKVFEIFNKKIQSPYIRVALGIHPQLTHLSNISLFEKYITKTKYIGEIGLDFSSSTLQIANKREQIKILEQIIVLSKNKILSIHSRKAEEVVLDCIEQNMDSDSTYILHWYTGNNKSLQRAINLGCYFSINLDFVKSKRFSDFAKTIPIERVLTETDAPFSKYGKIENIKKLTEELGILYNISKEKVKEQVFLNFCNILNKTR